MDGSIVGNFIGGVYFLLFQGMGICLMHCLLSKERPLLRVLLGSVAGSVMLQWMPAIWGFVCGFTRIGHGFALFSSAILTLLVFLWNKKQQENQRGRKGKDRQNTWKTEWGENRFMIWMLPVFVFFVLLLWNHTIPYRKDGSIRTGQATWGDMNMHLAFITSIAKQGIFPPEYSMLPGTRLSYPFLCDSISSSIYLWGSSLRFAYILPMLFAIAQVFTGTMLLGKYILKDKAKSLITWFFFIFNGGLGIWYFVRGITKDPSVFTRIFTGFYQTPTNFVDGNIRWANILVDILLPQRATLFGWAVLFPVLCLLYRGIETRKRRYYIITGILTGCLPMIHTHSFLAMAFVSAMWLIYSLRTQLNHQWKTKESKIEVGVFLGFLILMGILDLWRRVEKVSGQVYLGIAAVGVLGIGILCLYFVVKGLKDNQVSHSVWNWGILLGVVLLFSLPQLFLWTFQQAQGEQFVRGFFNWANENDTYFVFYIKNIGVVWVLALVALLFTRSKNYMIAAPAFFIWFVAELVVFQPNTYDNNKLLYVAYFFLCMVSADYLVEIYRKLPWKKIKGLAMACILFGSSIGAILTMGREYVSEYVLYSRDEVAMCKYIEKHTNPKDVILTDTRHNNGVVSLTGRNIVCGSSSFLYYHGLSYSTQEEDVGKMYQNPKDMTLFDKYHVKYIYVGDSEKYTYAIVDQNGFLDYFQEVHKEGNVTLYKRK